MRVRAPQSGGESVARSVARDRDDYFRALLVRRFAALSTTAPHDPLISMPTSVRIKGLVDNSACEPGKPDRLRTPRDRRLTPTRSPGPCPGGLTTFNREAPTHPLLTSSQSKRQNGRAQDVKAEVPETGECVANVAAPS
jgi:hypothetical protein